ncbi:hypothetical protein [Methylotenera sp.]|uniref:hypothetical protein n=1 Tax=Methylotenera sp. TaxID=2051956 RepID=UPI0024888E67|nr:hypothetical protein [Methylotenera sp.]MDI1361788.1 hypothetical protein [Methylotenera sp.]
MALADPVYACYEDCTPCEATVKSIAVGEITYATGGIGLCEANLMREMAKDYPLDLVFIQKLSNHEEFLADVKVQIEDRRRHLLLDVVTEGPYLFLKLPTGKYLIIAESNGVMKQQWVSVSSGKRQQVVFWWPILEIPD